MTAMVDVKTLVPTSKYSLLRADFYVALAGPHPAAGEAVVVVDPPSCTFASSCQAEKTQRDSRSSKRSLESS